MASPRKYWLLKSEPKTYAFGQLQEDGKTRWDGIRNYAARNHLRAMNTGDWALFYHSGAAPGVVGLARVERAAYPDPTAPKGEDWSAIDVAPVVALTQAVSLATLRGEKRLADMVLLRQGRLSVSPLTVEQFETIVQLSKTKVPAK